MKADPALVRDIETFRGTVVGLIRSDAADLTARQLAVFLTCYLANAPQTVRGLAEKLKVSRSVITRALDRLEALGLARRDEDPEDGRSVLVARTPPGTAFLQAVKLTGQRAAQEAARREEAAAVEQHEPDADDGQQRRKA